MNPSYFQYCPNIGLYIERRQLSLKSGITCINYKALELGVTVKKLDINREPLGEEWMEEEEESSNPRKKLRLTKEQSHLLEESFKQNHTLNPVTIQSSLYSFLSHHYIDRCLLIFCC